LEQGEIRRLLVGRLVLYGVRASLGRYLNVWTNKGDGLGSKVD